MKLLSLSMNAKNDNISYFNGSELKYFKLERKVQHKLASYRDHYNGWKNDIKNLWGVEVEDIDKIALISSHFCPSSKAVEQLVLELEPDKLWYIDHHYAHGLSVHAMTDKVPDVYITCDGSGDKKNLCVFKDHSLVEYKTSNSFGFAIRKIGERLGVTAQDREEIAGKLMSLQSYGNINWAFYNYLQEFTIDDVGKLSDFDLWKKNIKDDLVADLTKLDWAATTHKRMEELLIGFFEKHASETDTIFYSGGCAQNIIWNTSIRKRFKNLIIPPHCGDEGLSLGGMQWLFNKFEISNVKISNYPYCQSDITP